MNRCQQCGRDVSEEVEAEIANIADSLSPGQTPFGMYDYFEKRYVCKACQKGDSAASLQAPAGLGPDEDHVDARKQFERWDQDRISMGELARILSLVSSPPNFRSAPLPGDRRDERFDAWFDGGAINLGDTGGMSEYWFADGVRVDWAGLAPRLFVRIEWPDGRSVKIEQDRAVPAEEPAPTTTHGDRK